MIRPPRRTTPPAAFVLPLALAVLLMSTACPKKPPAPVADAPATDTTPAPPPAGLPEEEVREDSMAPPVEAPIEGEEIDETIRRQNQTREILSTVYFDFDGAEIRDDQVSVLQANAAWIRANPSYSILVEGHCDERDTIEYNFHLGEKRAKAIQQYLTDLGIPGARLRPISYGEERPADPGHDEEAWSKNRRAEFTLEK